MSNQKMNRESAAKIDPSQIPEGYIVLLTKPPPLVSAKYGEVTSIWDLLVGICFIFTFLALFFLR